MTNQSTPIIKQFVAFVRIKPFGNSLKFVENLAEVILTDLDLKVVEKISHLFSPTGITLGYILSQSHLVIHTYPDEGIIHIDLAICSDHSEKEFENSLKRAFAEYKIFSLKIKTFNFDN